MEEETQRIWIIPGSGLEDKNLHDGVPLYFEGSIGDRDHKEIMRLFCREYNLEAEFCTTHIDYGKYLTNLGAAVFFNSGFIGGKYAGSFYMPSCLTKKQIEFFENKKELFKEKFHDNVGLFDAGFLPEGDLDYKTANGFRDLKIESIIEGKPSNNGQELLYREIERQKANMLGGKSI